MKTLKIKIKDDTKDHEQLLRLIEKGNIEFKDNGEVRNSLGTKIGSWK